MSELGRAFLTSSFTVIGGVLIFTLGQMIVRFVIEPLHEQARLIGEITSSLTFFANVRGTKIEELYLQKIIEIEATGATNRANELGADRYKNLIEQHWQKKDTASELLRKQASELLATTHAIPFCRFWVFWHRVPEFEDILKASTALIGLSNSVHHPTYNDANRIEEIAELLKLKVISQK